jgi:23S rRNA (adenine2503-C2)-methyltransferase
MITTTTTISAPAGSAPPAAGPIDLLGLSRQRLAEVLAPVADRPFRARQIYRALYERAARDFADMTDLPQELRRRLTAGFRVGLPEIAERRAAADGACKYLLRLADGASIEAVDIPDRGRRTFCISSQAGCALACSFCVTGYWGAGRNLTAGEIVGQVLAIRADRGLPMAGLNIVFMGMGEPLLNLENVKAALDLLAEWISPQRITVSTVGILPALAEMARWQRRPNLAVSLHAPDEARRSEIMPVNRTYPLAELMAALRRYPLEKGRKLTFEYILIRGFNDRGEDADRLSSLLAGLRAKINLIPINPDPVLGPDMVPPDAERIEAFKERLRRHGWIATVRRRRGDDVSAACGQLRAFGREARGFRKQA